MVTHQPLLSLDWNLLFSLITVIVLILILKKFFFEKVHNFMMDRQQKVKDQFDEAQAKQEEAETLKAQYQVQLDNAESEKKALLAEARSEAQMEAEKLIREAHQEATRIREDAEVAIAQRKEEAKKELENEISDLAILAAQKIMEKSATAEGTGIPGDTLTNSEEMSIRHKVDELKIHMNQENEDQ